jgi:hypothetical protein
VTIPVFTIIHSLPDRVRLHFSIPPANFDDVKRRLLKDKRIRQLEYSWVSHTCVIHYDHKKIEFLQILKLLTLALADEYHRQPVHVRPKDLYQFTALTKISAMAIIIASASRLMNINTMTGIIVGWTAVTATAAAVIEHAYTEIKGTGSFDPEALSIVYLFNSVGRGQLLSGALFTWLASFSRHLLRLPYLEGLKLTVIEGFGEGSEKKYMDVVTSGSISMSSLEGQKNEAAGLR